MYMSEFSTVRLEGPKPFGAPWLDQVGRSAKPVKQPSNIELLMTTFIGFSAVPVPSFSRQSSRIISARTWSR